MATDLQLIPLKQTFPTPCKISEQEVYKKWTGSVQEEYKKWKKKFTISFQEVYKKWKKKVYQKCDKREQKH